MNLLTKRGYYERVIMYIRKGYTHSKAWELVQDEFDVLYPEIDHKGYQSYEGYRAMLHRYLKK